jgi:hypothetical protein
MADTDPHALARAIHDQLRAARARGHVPRLMTVSATSEQLARALDQRLHDTDGRVRQSFQIGPTHILPGRRS